MSQFSLDNFIENEKSVKPIPDWAKKRPLIEKIYNLIQERISDIEKLIKSSTREEVDQLKVKDYKIVIRDITEQLGASSSNVRKDREPELFKYISEQNSRLERLIESKRTNISSGELSKEQLKIALDKLRKEHEKATQKNMHDYFQMAVEQNIIGSQKQMADELTEAKKRNAELQQKITVLEGRIKGLIRELNNNGSI